MKKIFWMVICLLVFSGEVFADGQIGIGNVEPPRGLCQSVGGVGFTRQAPGVCIVNNNGILVFADSNTTCRTFNLGLPPGVRTASFRISMGVQSQNVAGALRGSVLQFYSNAGCSAIVRSYNLYLWEFSAVAAFTEIGRLDIDAVMVPVFNGNAYIQSGALNSGLLFNAVYLTGYTES